MAPTLDEIKRDMDAIKFVMLRTTDPIEKINLATIGLEKTAMFLQAFGYTVFTKEDHHRNIYNLINIFDYNRPQKKKRKKRKKRLVKVWRSDAA
jgi:hypothetical protein